MKFSWSGKAQAAWIGVGVGAAITGLVAVIANHDNTGTNSGAVVTAVIWVWVILAIAGVGATVFRKLRRP